MLITNVSTKPNVQLTRLVNKPEALKSPSNSSIENRPSEMPSAALMKVYFSGAKSIWAQANQAKRTQIHSFADDFKSFLTTAKTDITATKEIIKLAESNGFKPWPEEIPQGGIKPGDKFYRNNRNREVSLIVAGQKPLETGFKMIGSHIDSPCIWLKPRPVKEADGGFAVLKTMVHGGIKNHQWTQRNLALVGLVAKPGGEMIEVNIGNRKEDPVLIIPELPPHTDWDKTKSIGSSFPDETLNPIAANSEPDSLDEKTEKTVSDQVLQILKDKYNINEEDLVHAQLALVPAEEPRDVGLDSSMISAYGIDDKSSAFCAVKGLIDYTNELESQGKTPEQTLIATQFSNEEIGSWNNYGAQSDETRAIIAELMEYSQPDKPYSENAVRKAFKNSLIVSADVSHAIDPVRPYAEEATNSAKLGFGPVHKKNGAKFSLPEASRAFEDTQKDIQFQTYTYHQDNGGGGTIGNYVATQQNADVVDTGIPLLGMHSPLELANKSDLYEHYLSAKSYFAN